MQDQLYILLKKLVIKNNVHINQDELKLQLQSHPSYPSLHSVTGVMDHFSIPNLAIKVPQTQEVLEQLPSGFLAVTNEDGIEDIAYVEKKKERFKIRSQSNDSKTITSKDFLSIWNGVLIAIEPEEGEVNKQFSQRTILLALIIVVFAGISVYAFFNSSMFSATHFLLSSIGFMISVLIVKHDLGIQTQLENSFCNLSKKTSCDAVLNGKGSVIFNKIKLSDLSLVTFLGYVFIYVLSSMINVHSELLMAILSLCGVAVALYSVYYQAIVIKKWCPLCLGIVGVLVVQASSILLMDVTHFTFIPSLTSLLAVFTGFALAITSWYFLKPLLQSKNDFTTLQVTHQKFKRTFSIFNTLLNQKKALETNPSITNELIFGHHHAPLTITLVTSPYCFYCKAAHKDVVDILKKGKERVKVRVRFMTDPSQQDALYKVVSEVMHVYHTQGPKACLNLLDILYESKTDLNHWVSNTNIHYNPSYDAVIEQQLDWSRSNNINFTPALYIGNKPFPSEYNRTDITQFIDDLIEVQSTNTTTVVHLSKQAS